MDEEKNVKAIDAIYKNILERFNPESKKMLLNAKTYLKALQNSSQASKLFSESLTKLAENAQSAPGAKDIGSALAKIIDVFKSIEEQHQQILKVIYVDFICPLETNLAKDVKVIQAEQKKFSHQLKMRTDSFDKATAAVKKHRKKKNNAERELKCIQMLEEEKKNLDNFMQRESNNALLQERRRYGFILERYTESIAKHYLHFFNNSFESINSNIQRWNEIAATREMITTSPMSAEGTLSRKNNGETLTIKKDNENFNSRRNLERVSLSLSDESESNLSINNNNKNDSENSRPPHYSMDKIASNPNNRIVVAVYGYTATQENQLSFAEGDKICLIGDNISGWRFGENVKTKTFGWFPSSYVNGNHPKTNGNTKENDIMNEGTFGNTLGSRYSISKQRNFQNPPAVRAPSPPASQNNEMNAKKSLRGIYSSNDSGFDNEVPPIAPEIDYSDDDDNDDDDNEHMPQKVPIRKPNDGFLSSGQSNSHGDLTENISTMKRNKGFWRFSRSEDLLEGMGLWKHRDLLPIENMDDSTLKKSSVNYKKPVEKNTINSEIFHQRMSKEKPHEEGFDDIYDETPKRRNHTGPVIMNENSFYKELQDTNFYDDDDDDVLVRTVKRKEILKQYHSSETDTELSINSDPYDCVLQKTNNNTLLPRTKLLKARNESYDHGLESSSNKTKAKSFQSWHH